MNLVSNTSTSILNLGDSFKKVAPFFDYGGTKKTTTFFSRSKAVFDYQKNRVSCSPFGVVLDGRNGTATSELYTYGFQGQEKDNEIKGDNNSYDYGARFHDSRLGRFLSLDPKASSYPFMTPYCYAGNSPLYFYDANGEGPKPAINSFVDRIVDSYGSMMLEALQKSNNTSLGDLEKWALGFAGFSKSTANKIVGAVGEAIVAEHLANSVGSANLIYKKLSFQERTSANNKSTPDIVVNVTVTETSWKTKLGLGIELVNWRDNAYTHPYHSANGEGYEETYEEDVWPKQVGKIYVDNETYQFQYEVKTLNPKNVYSNVKALYNGLFQVEGRLDKSTAENPIGVLVTDKLAYMNIVNAADKGNKRAQNFIQRVDTYISNGGRLLLVEDLYGKATRTTYSMRDRIRKTFNLFKKKEFKTVETPSF